MIDECKKENTELKSFNPIIAECNDSRLNNITHRILNRENVFEAIENVKMDFELGDTGAGKGMICHGLKGGIGSSSRIFCIAEKEFTLGVLVLTNHGKLEDLIVNGENIGEKISKKINAEKTSDKGSVIIIFATDLPLTSRQLKRVAKRASVGLARLGSYIGHGSGEIVMGFSTANVINSKCSDIFSVKITPEDKLDMPFRAIAEATEEAVLNSMMNSEDIIGYSGTKILSLRNFLK